MAELISSPPIEALLKIGVRKEENFQLFDVGVERSAVFSKNPNQVSHLLDKSNPFSSPRIHLVETGKDFTSYRFHDVLVLEWKNRGSDCWEQRLLDLSMTALEMKKQMKKLVWKRKPCDLTYHT